MLAFLRVFRYLRRCGLPIAYSIRRAARAAWSR